MGQFIREVIVNLKDFEDNVIGIASFDIDWFPLSKGSLSSGSAQKVGLAAVYIMK